MKSKHTPAPWIVDDRHIHCAEGLTYPADSPVNRNVMLETDVIMEVDTSCHPNGLLTETDKANLVLAAAAPEMLEALQKIYSNAAESVEWIRRVAGKAIAKVEGAPHAP